MEARLSDVSTQSEIAVEKYNQASTQLDTVQAQIDENQHSSRWRPEPRAGQPAAHDARPEHLQVARRRLHRRALLDGQLRRAHHPARPDGASRQQRRRHRQVHRGLQARHQGPRIKLEADEKAAARLVAEREQHKNELIALQANLERLTGKIKKQIKKLKYQAKLRAQLALTGYSGPIPGPVDPNSPGHPEIVAIAQRYFGVPYVWGGAGPSGFDCTGLTMYCYAQIGIGMSHGATDQQRASIPVALTDLRPGDLIFFGNASFSHHVAIFVGGTT